VLVAVQREGRGTHHVVAFSRKQAHIIRNEALTLYDVFRKYDRRRYSMFYHRQMAYRMVQDYEKKHGFKFDWVRNPVLQALYTDKSIDSDLSIFNIIDLGSSNLVHDDRTTLTTPYAL
jgi:hypothetical protein